MIKMERFRKIKEEIRILAWDDGPFKFGSKGKDILVGVIFRGSKILDGFLKTEVKIDGTDATKKIIDKILKTRHKDLRIVMLDGITVAGFNVVDIKQIYEKTKLPVIISIRKKPDMEKFITSLKKLPNSKKRIKSIENAGPIYTTTIKDKRVYFQCYGIEKNDAEEIIKKTSTVSLIPEPLRVAHLIATGFILGESVGRA
jgi:endonuclease V-like protein UPF0215 family